jgi:hypothetical protein
MEREKVQEVKISSNQIWGIIGIVALWVFGETAVALKNAGITAQSLDAFFSDLSQGELFAALGASATGGAGFLFGGRHEKAKKVKELK